MVKQTAPASSEDPLVKELAEVRRRGIDKVDGTGRTKNPLELRVLRQIVDSPETFALDLRKLISDAIDGTGEIPGIRDSRMKRVARLLYGLEADEGGPTEWREQAARAYDAEKYGYSGYETWRKAGVEDEIKALIAMHIRARNREVQSPPPSEISESLQERDERTRIEFKRVREAAAINPKRIIASAILHHDRERRDRGIPLLTKEGWIPSRPLPLHQVLLEYVEDPGSEYLHRARAQLVHYWPTAAGQSARRYSDAVQRYDRPRSFFDGTSYRLLGVQHSDHSPKLEFTTTQYWDHFDTGEALLFEAAWQQEHSFSDEIDGPFRQWLGDPFDLSRRSGIPGINTLTVRRSPGGLMFYLVQRGNVATAVGTVHVIPAGEFQPSRDGAPHPEELKIEATMVREYVEEMLDHQEAREPSLPPIDVAQDEPYRPIYDEIMSGGASAWYLGIGLYPVTWKPEILTVCVFDREEFDTLFAKMQKTGQEGTIIGPDERVEFIGVNYDFKEGRPYKGIPFTEKSVKHYATHPGTLPAGRACLSLAWRHRHELGLSVD
ncbi:hypothetical protein AB0E04_45845 [Streptomyces sp. NPDC048251]|uniref:hypothetical protein n=1 Tax=Streptomyces sp. NPDC048251 TaxID=3154501 RepID=UPI003440EE10